MISFVDTTLRCPSAGNHCALDQGREDGGGRRLTTFVMEMPSNEAIKQAVMAGMGVSLLSLHTIELEWKNGLIAAPAVEGMPLMRRWNVVYAAGKYLSPAAEAFRYFMLEHAEAHLASLFREAQ